MSRARFLPVVAAGGLGGILGAAWYLGRPGRSLSSLVVDVGALVTGSIRLTTDQTIMLGIIDSEARSAGLAGLFRAAAANAYAESRLNPEAVGDGGNSIGLFQLNANGAGKGLSVAQRKDPRTNARTIFGIVNGTDGAVLRSMLDRGASDEDLASEFAHSIERCAACGHQGGDSELAVRRALVVQLFGGSVEVLA